MSDLQRLKQSEADVRKMLAEWRSNGTHEVQLPLSGRILQVRDVGVIDLALTGKIPNTMLDLVQQMKSGKLNEADMLKENAAEFSGLLNDVFKAAVVSPPVADIADDDHISVDEFVFGDKMALFNWVNREATILRPFRKESDEPVATAPSRKELRKTSK